MNARTFDEEEEADGGDDGQGEYIAAQEAAQDYAWGGNSGTRLLFITQYLKYKQVSCTKD